MNTERTISLSKLKKREFLPKKIKNISALFLIILIFSSAMFVFEGRKEKAKAFTVNFGYSYKEVLLLNKKFSKRTDVPLPMDQIDTAQNAGDKRIIAVLRFLEKYNSPMASLSVAKSVIDSADKYNLGDKWPLVIAIPGIESGFGRLIPYGNGVSSYNAWGWTCGGASNCVGRWRYFDSWEDGVEAITYGLVTGYGGPDNLYPERIMPSYCPDCMEGGGAWAVHVNGYINEIWGIYNSM